MQWTDDALVLGLRRHGESGVILEAMTAEHGRHLGLVHGGRSRRMQPVLQPGNRVRVTWRARLDEGLAPSPSEPLASEVSRMIGSGLALYGLGALGALLRLLPEREPASGALRGRRILVEHLDDPAIAPPLMVRFELAVLTELGFGLDLSACAATGGNDRLAYVSPRTGRAVSAAAGEPYKDRLLALPTFLREGGAPGPDGVAQGFTLTGYFLDRHVWVRAASRHRRSGRDFVALGVAAG